MKKIRALCLFFVIIALLSGLPLAAVYGVYYVLAKRDLYRKDITPWGAFRAICRGMAENKITKQAKTN